MTGTKVPARFNANAPRACLQMNFGVCGNELGGEADDLMARTGNLQMGEDLRRHEFIHENPAVLRVILELDDVIIAIVRFQQMGLCAASHLADEPAGVYGHGIRGKDREGIN